MLKTRHHFGRSLGLLEAIYIIFEYATLTHVHSHTIDCQFYMGTRLAEGSASSSSCKESYFPLAPYDPADPTIAEVSVANAIAVWNLWQAPVGESRCCALEFWSKSVPTSAENYSFLGDIASDLLLDLHRG